MSDLVDAVVEMSGGDWQTAQELFEVALDAVSEEESRGEEGNSDEGS